MGAVRRARGGRSWWSSAWPLSADSVTSGTSQRFLVEIWAFCSLFRSVFRSASRVPESSHWKAGLRSLATISSSATYR